MQPFRIEPNMPARAYDTYGVAAPRNTHTRKGTCEEVTSPCSNYDSPTNPCKEWHCGASAHGWQTLVDVSTTIGQRQARYIVDHSGRHWTAQQDGSMVTFTFPPGQQCFADHRVPLDRPPLFTLKHGDWRIHNRPSVLDGDEWLDRFANNQITLKEKHDRG